MRRETLVALGIGLAIALAIGAGALWINRGSHLALEGSVQKVRFQGQDASTAVIADFRAANTSDVPFVVRDVLVIVVDANGKDVEGTTVADSDAARFLDYYKQLGPKYNDSLKVKDRISAKQSVDRMIAARFDLPEAQVQARKNLRIRIEDVDGTVSEIFERTGK